MRPGDYDRMMLGASLGLILGTVGNMLLARAAMRRMRAHARKREYRSLFVDKKDIDRLRGKVLPSEVPIYIGGARSALDSYYLPPSGVQIIYRMNPKFRRYFDQNPKVFEQAKKHGLIVVPKRVHMHVLLHELGHARPAYGRGSQLWAFIRDKARGFITMIPIIGPGISSVMIDIPEEVLASMEANRMAKEIAEHPEFAEIFKRKKAKPEEVRSAWRTLFPALSTYLPAALLLAGPLVGGYVGYKYEDWV